MKFRKIIQLYRLDGMVEDKDFLGYLEKQVKKSSFQEKLCDLGTIHEIPMSSSQMRNREEYFVEAWNAVDKALKNILDGYKGKNKPRPSLKVKKNILQKEQSNDGRESD